MRRGKMKKWKVTAIALLMVMIFATPMSGLKVQAEESIQSEMANVDVTIANKEVGYNSFGVQPAYSAKTEHSLRMSGALFR